VRGFVGVRGEGRRSIMKTRAMGLAVALAFGAVLAFSARATADEKIVNAVSKGNGVELQFADKTVKEVACPVTATFYEEFNDGKKLHASGVLTSQCNTPHDLEALITALRGLPGETCNFVDYKPAAKGQKEGVLDLQVVLAGKFVNVLVSPASQSLRLEGPGVEEDLNKGQLAVMLSWTGMEEPKQAAFINTAQEWQGLEQKVEAFKKMGAICILEGVRKGAGAPLVRVHFLVPKR
jgi:hypothetical protein